MGELTKYFKIAKRFIQEENSNSTKPGFSPIFEFPFTDDYINWVHLLAKTIPKEGKKNWVRPYSDLIDNQIIPSGIKIPVEWLRRIRDDRNEYFIGYRTNSVYMISDINENLLYIGKCQFPPIIRLFDRMIPKKLNSQNNVTEIWDTIISQGQKVKCAYCYNLSFDPGNLEYHLIYEYKIKKGMEQLLNKQKRSSKYHNKVMAIRKKLKM